MCNTICGCISKGVGFMLPIVDYHLKEQYTYPILLSSLRGCFHFTDAS